MATSGQEVLSDVITGKVLDEESFLTLLEVSRASAVHADYVVELVEEGVVQPVGHHPTQWRFSAMCLVKIRKAVRLQHDLGVNLAGVALALQLMEELELANARLRLLQRYEP